MFDRLCASQRDTEIRRNVFLVVHAISHRNLGLFQQHMLSRWSELVPMHLDSIKLIGTSPIDPVPHPLVGFMQANALQSFHGGTAEKGHYTCMMRSGWGDGGGALLLHTHYVWDL